MTTEERLKKLAEPLDIKSIDFRECFIYSDGLLIWKERPIGHFKNARGMNSFNVRFAGKVAGSLHRPSGYVHLDAFGKKHKAHRIIWALHYGEMPEHIDHINGKKHDNRIENLRSVGHGENMKNRPMPRDNKSGLQGVHWLKSNAAWCAYITSNGIRYHLGLYVDWFEAVCARKSSELKHGFHSNHGRNYGY